MLILSSYISEIFIQKIHIKNTDNSTLNFIPLNEKSSKEFYESGFFYDGGGGDDHGGFPGSNIWNIWRPMSISNLLNQYISNQKDFVLGGPKELARHMEWVRQHFGIPLMQKEHDVSLKQVLARLNYLKYLHISNIYISARLNYFK